jgi:hypothetical protein
MKTQFKKWTLFFILGIAAIMTGLAVSIILMTGASAPDALFGMYLLLGLIPVLLVVVTDRILVWKFGNKIVNKVQVSILAFVALLWIVRFVVDVLS